MNTKCLSTASLLAAALTVIALMADASNAQTRRYRPNTPTVSPYLNLTRTNTSALPNYYSLVRPQQVQQEINQRERLIRQQQAGALQRLGNELQQGLVPVSPTGKSASFFYQSNTYRFQNTAGYYQQRNAIRSRNFR